MKQINENWIPYVNLVKQFSEERKPLLKEIERVLCSGKYILSDEVEKFEKEICNYQKNRFCMFVKR